MVRFFRPMSVGQTSDYEPALGRPDPWAPRTGTAAGYGVTSTRAPAYPAFPSAPVLSAPPRLGPVSGGGGGGMTAKREQAPVGTAGGGGGIAGALPSRYQSLEEALREPQRVGLEQATNRRIRLTQSWVRDLGDIMRARGFQEGGSSIHLNALQKLYESAGMEQADIEQRALAEARGLHGQLATAGLATMEAREAADLAYERRREELEAENRRRLALQKYQTDMALWQAQNQGAQTDYANRVNWLMNQAQAMQPQVSTRGAGIPAYSFSGTVPFQSRGGVIQTAEQGPVLDPRQRGWGVGLPQRPPAVPPVGQAQPGGMGGMGGPQTQPQLAPGQQVVYSPGSGGSTQVWIYTPNPAGGGTYTNVATGMVLGQPPPGAYSL